MGVVDIAIQTITQLLEPYGFLPSIEIAEKIQLYISLLRQWNKSIALTSIDDPSEIVKFHCGESIFALTSGLIHGGRLADVGSGAGFPGVPLALACPGLDVTLIESNLKKCAFLKELCRKIRIEDQVHVFSGRTEDMILSANSLLDYVTARAVGQIPNILEFSAAHLKPLGRAVLWVGQKDAQRIPLTAAENWKWLPPILIPGSINRFILSAQFVPRETS